MKPDEEWVTFASRWQEMATKSGLDIPERQVVQTLIANTTGPMKRGLANAYCPSVTALYEVATSVKENMHEFQDTEDNAEGMYHVQVGKQWDQPPQAYRQNGNHSERNGNDRGNHHHAAPQQQTKGSKRTS